MSSDRLDCIKCPSLCCRMAGYVEVSKYDIRRLAKHLDLTVEEFEEKHIVEKTRRSKRIKCPSCQPQYAALVGLWCLPAAIFPVTWPILWHPR